MVSRKFILIAFIYIVLSVICPDTKNCIPFSTEAFAKLQWIYIFACSGSPALLSHNLSDLVENKA